MNDIIVGVVSSLAAILIIFIIQYFRKTFGVTKQQQLLNFGKEIMFIYAVREEKIIHENGVLPRTSTEDFLAINKIQTILLKSSFKGEIIFRESRHFGEEDRQRDLIFICGPFSNPGTKEVLSEIYKIHPIVPLFEKDPVTHRKYLIFGEEKLESNSYEIIEECKIRKIKFEDVDIKDYGMIIKTRNPWAHDKMMLVLAGIRGIGTWGAAECLSSNWRELYSRKRNDGKHSKKGDFAAIIEVTIKKGDIISLYIRNMIDLD